MVEVPADFCYQENGPFVALKDGTLRALQIYVHAEPNNRSKVIETYTFTIKYGPRGGSEQMFAGIELDSHASSILNVEISNLALQEFFRKVSQLCEPLPILPGLQICPYSLMHKRPADL